MSIYYSVENKQFKYEMESNEFAFQLLLPADEIWKMILDFRKQQKHIDELIKKISKRYEVGLHETSLRVDQLLRQNGFFMMIPDNRPKDLILKKALKF